MREIKFRAWHPEEERMWLDVGTDGNGGIILDTRNMGLKPLKGEAHLMQYTGLKDENGVEIYEGDIICYGMWSDGKGKCLYKVFWNEEDACFDTFDLRHKQEMTHIDTYEAEVIGNIWEQKELLNGKQT